MKLQSTVTIGIPAHNEAQNIGQLLENLNKQDTEGSADIIEIIIGSDGSSDGTNQIVSSFPDKRVILLPLPQRHGKAVCQNHIIAKAKGDILVLLDADISITDPRFIAKMIKPILEDTADMTSSNLTELKPRVFFETVLAISMRLKKLLFEQFNSGHNAYTCYGPVRAFTKSLYKKLNFVESDGEDMYSYLYCIQSKMRFVYVKNAKVYYRLPANFADHFKQSTRYLKVHKQFGKHFDPAMVRKELTIPLSVYIAAGLKALPIFMKFPLHCLIYLLVLVYINIQATFNTSPKETWGVASTKSRI